MEEREREQLIERLVEQYRQTLQRQLRRNPRTITEIEQLVEDVSQEMDQELEQAILDRPTPAEGENQARCPQCHGWARYRCTAVRVLVTRHGTRRLGRRYYYCLPCHLGFAPRDAVLGLDASPTTPTVRAFVAQLAAHLPFATTASLLAQLTGVQLGASTVERTAVAVGTALRNAQRTQARQHHRGQGPPVTHKPQRLYVSVDGIFAPLREPWKKDGSAGALVCRYGECKTAVVYEARPGPQGDAGVTWRAYTATFEKAETFGALVATLAHRHGQHFAREVIFLADGQATNWSLAAAHFPGAVQILDFMHAVQHLYTVAHTFFGEGTAPVQPWVDACKDHLLHDRLAAVLQAIEDLPPRTLAQRDVQVRELGYFRANRERMRYGTFRARGYQIATGVMEAGCKHVVHQRLDQAGMHWRTETAEAIVALRAALLSVHPPDLLSYCGTSH